MALTKEEKTKRVDEVKAHLSSAKLTVAARYSGTPVKAMQDLRAEAKAGGTTIMVVKNRLFKKALADAGLTEAAQAMPLSGQLMYAFNPDDEVAPAQVLANFTKTNPQIELVTGLNADGQILEASDLALLASLPSKDQLCSQLIGTLRAPFNNLVGTLAASNRRILHVLTARAEQTT